MQSITTVAGEIFTTQETIQLAKLLLKRFGSIEQATLAWQRMMQNSITVQDFIKLIK